MLSRARSPKSVRVDYRGLAEVRHEIRRFLHASELAARAEGLEPQQHQLLLALKGAATTEPATVAWIAERLQLRHHSVVGLLDRLQSRRFVRRHRDPIDHRRVQVTLTTKGETVLHRLSVIHQQEIRMRAPNLIGALTAVVGTARRRPW